MTRRILAALPLVAGLFFAGGADAFTVNFSFGGDGNASGFGTITVGPDPFADTTGIFGTPANLLGPSAGPPPNFQGAVDPANALAITDATGTFSDKILNIDNVAITGIFATDPQNPSTVTRRFAIVLAGTRRLEACPTTICFTRAGMRRSPASACRPAASSMTMACCLRSPMGISWISTRTAATRQACSVVVWADGAADHTSAMGLSLTAPEPSTWAMMVVGFAGLGFAGYRKSRKVAAVAA
jgi:PEP-CTERM motif